jgi:DNA-binding IclR family transcriptional regulator
MRSEHTHVDGEVPISESELERILVHIRERGYLERESSQTYGVVDISYPILGPDNVALATLTCPYIRNIDSHIGPDQSSVREYLREASRTLSLTQGMHTASLDENAMRPSPDGNLAGR